MCNRLASHIERGTAFRRATMWTLQQIMDGGAMGVQITISGKLRGDRSAFEKHSVGILPRAGHHADVIVAEDIAHVKTPMGLIGVRIRIARKDKFIPEFELKEKPKKEAKPIEKKESDVIPEKIDKDEISKLKEKANTESEQIELETKLVEKIETLEDEEEKLK
jgi:small subunit ribosomal protein S3